MPVITQLPATAIYFVEWRKNLNAAWQKFGHVVVNESDTYQSQNHTYQKGYESWWTTTNKMKDVNSRAQQIRFAVEAVAGSLSQLANLIAQLEAEQYASHRFDTPCQLTQNDWTQLQSSVAGPVFAGQDSGGQLLVRVGPILDQSDGLGDLEWYADQPLTGTPYFGGQASQGETVTLDRLSSGHNDWPGAGDYVHKSSS